MKTRLPGILLMLSILAFAGVQCGGGPRNCLVIPAQIDILQERRDALLADLEATARRVDRQASTLETARKHVGELEAERALIDSLKLGEEQKDSGRITIHE
ncbi:MAG: hypothetical protein V1774_02355 [Candidatus Eisenbacteria bacterium]